METTTRFFSYTQRYTKTFMLAGLLACAYGFFAAAPAYLLQHMVDGVLVAKQTTLLLPFIGIFLFFFPGKSNLYVCLNLLASANWILCCKRYST